MLVLGVARGNMFDLGACHGSPCPPAEARRRHRYTQGNGALVRYGAGRKSRLVIDVRAAKPGTAATRSALQARMEQMRHRGHSGAAIPLHRALSTLRATPRD